MEIGSRVMALSHTKNKVAYIFGTGVYQGDEIPDGSAGPFGEVAKAVGRKNPKILLDSGKVVWGCECWWGPEEVVKKKLSGMQLVEIDIEEARQKVTN